MIISYIFAPMQPLARRLERFILAALSRLDAAMNRLYGWRYNPLYQSGAIAVVLLAVITVTGLYLVIFYRIGTPFESVERITSQVWVGRWIRGLHRYASDGAIVAVLVHAARMFAQGRSWGPRTLAWVSGVTLLGLLFICGWTGYVMVWDQQGQALAVEGARLLDALPIFAEPISRTFVGEAPVPSAFFFLNLFLHIVLPVGLGAALWLHVSRLARPTIVPPRKLMYGVTALLFALAVVWPVASGPRAELLELPGRVPVDWFYVFWFPLTRGLPPVVALVALVTVAIPVVFVPLWTKPPGTRRPTPSVVEERYCTGCEQCSLDCPYEAIAMLEREDNRSELFARVDPALCVSCGICAGSCAPMGVGPPGRTGRDQLARLRDSMTAVSLGTADVVLVACDRGAGRIRDLERVDGTTIHRVSCAGNMHTSVVEFYLRAGAGAVVVLACPPRDCWNREGPIWLAGRMYQDREAELQPRVDRRRVRLAYVAAGESHRVAKEVALARDSIANLTVGIESGDDDLIRECEVEEETVP
jgi:quinol-cytochrome oxidoreductase complex cytochrome b subunit/coenzyme F420-reducing hydrogenase delta subunit